MGSEGIATVKYWYEKYGAVPAAITYDEIEFYVERPVQTFEEARKLAIEQYAFCYGLLWECYDTLDELASAIYKKCTMVFLVELIKNKFFKEVKNVKYKRI